MPYRLSSEAMFNPPLKSDTSGNTISTSTTITPSSHPQPTDRISPKCKSLSQAKHKWKENLRKECLERAKSARRDKLRRKRSSCDGDEDDSGNTAANATVRYEFGTSARVNTTGIDQFQGMKRGRDDRDNSEWHNESEIDQTAHSNHHVFGEHGEHNWLKRCDASTGYNNSNNNYIAFSHGENHAIHAAKELVEQELQKALMGMRHCRQTHPLGGDVPSKKTHWNRRVEEAAAMAFETDGMDEKELDGNEDPGMGGDYELSHEEFLDLLHEVTEELQLEGKLSCITS
jgi:hypothetical protein